MEGARQCPPNGRFERKIQMSMNFLVLTVDALQDVWAHGIMSLEVTTAFALPHIEHQPTRMKTFVSIKVVFQRKKLYESSWANPIGLAAKK